MVKKVSTSAKNMIECVRSVPKPRTLYIEEGTLASWVVETCHLFSENVVVTDPKINHWIGKDENKSDPIDAKKLAQLTRGGYIKEIHHAVGDRSRFRELILFYHDQIKVRVQIMNKIKCKFRQNGIQCRGETVFLKSHRDTWLSKMDSHIFSRLMIQNLWKELDMLSECIEDVIVQIKLISKKYPEIKIFKTMPGIGDIHAATISAIIEDPNRFATEKKVWKYAGLGISRRGYGDKTYSVQLTHDYNRLLKYTIKQATIAAIRSKDNPFKNQFNHLTLFKIKHPQKALITVARKYLRCSRLCNRRHINSKYF